MVVDDLLSSLKSNMRLQTLFTRDSHHLNDEVFLLGHNLFEKSPIMRTIALNTK